MLPPPDVAVSAPRWLLPFKGTTWGRQRIEWGYGSVPLSQLLVNFIFQRVFRLNPNAPFSVNFRSTVTSGENIRLGRRVGISFAAVVESGPASAEDETVRT